jgi:hypothetical protein
VRDCRLLLLLKAAASLARALTNLNNATQEPISDHSPLTVDLPFPAATKTDPNRIDRNYKPRIDMSPGCSQSLAIVGALVDSIQVYSERLI